MKSVKISDTLYALAQREATLMCLGDAAAEIERAHARLAQEVARGERDASTLAAITRPMIEKAQFDFRSDSFGGSSSW